MGKTRREEQRSGWREVTLGEIVGVLRAGVSVNSEDREADPGEVGVLKTSCVAEGKFRYCENKAVVFSDCHRVAESPRRNGIIISRMNTKDLVGASALVEDDCPYLFLPDRLWQAQVKSGKETCARWLAYMLQSSGVLGIIKARASGTSGSMKNLSKEALLTVSIPFPSLKEQESIAGVLQLPCRALDLISDLVALKRRRKAGYARRLLRLTQSRRDTDTIQRVRLGEIFSERNDIDHGTLQLLSITATEGIVRRASIAKKDISPGDKDKYKRIAPGDIGYNTMRMWQGVSALSQLEGIVSPAYTVCIPGPRIDGRFAKHLFKYPPMVHTFWRYSQGLVDDTLSLKFHNFAQIKIHLPPIEEQRRIADTLDALDREIDLLTRQADALARQKKGLMEKLLTGQIRVKG